MNRATVLGTLMTVVMVAACGSPTGVDFDPASYDAIPELEDLDWAAVEPAEDWDYWELRAGGVMGDSLIGSGGRLSDEELDEDTRASLAGTRPQTGFSTGCLPGHCYRYIIAVDGSEISTVVDMAGLRAFLTPITSREEAILLVLARDLVWPGESGTTGVRAAGAAWDLVVLELVRICAPIQMDRVRFRVHPDGRVSERAREVWERHEGACI